MTFETLYLIEFRYRYPDEPDANYMDCIYVHDYSLVRTKDMMMALVKEYCLQRDTSILVNGIADIKVMTNRLAQN